MTLAAENGCSLILQTEGDDEKEAADAIIHLFTTGFGEVCLALSNWIPYNFNFLGSSYKSNGNNSKKYKEIPH